MRKNIQPRFPEDNHKLRRAVLQFGDERRLAAESGVTLATIRRIADGKSKFPWAQTVKAIEHALKRLQPTPIVTSWAPTPQTRQVKQNHQKRLQKKQAPFVIRRSERRRYNLPV